MKIFAILFFVSSVVSAQQMSDMHHDNLHGAVMREGDCDSMEAFDEGMGMCMPVPMKDMTMSMLMLHGNGFVTFINESGPRGRTALASTNMIMADFGTTLGDHHYLNLDLMGTVERWTVPDGGYPELLQIGEENNQGVAYVDAQHPHSSPVMGLTLSDTIGFETNKDNLKLFAAPRGEATDGPIAFMHRVTGMANPDAPLGHHIGQDVGHVTSSVVGASLKLGEMRLETSTYHGAEPKPQNVDLPLGTLDSYSFRLMQSFTPHFLVMASYAFVSNPEPSDPDVVFENRYSASVYSYFAVAEHWTFDNTLIWGAVSNYDHASTLTSFAEEFLLTGDRPRIWGRVEILQRTPAELFIVNSGDPNGGQWVTAATLGYTHALVKWPSSEVGLGASVTADFLPTSYQTTYGGNPWAGKVFLQVGGMKMFDL